MPFQAMLQEHGCDARLDDDTRSALEWWVRFLGVAAPRRVNLDCFEMPVLIFTDGAFEKGIATIGGESAVFFLIRLTALSDVLVAK